jgi:hypothetical protein
MFVAHHLVALDETAVGRRDSVSYAATTGVNWMSSPQTGLEPRLNVDDVGLGPTGEARLYL